MEEVSDIGRRSVNQKACILSCTNFKPVKSRYNNKIIPYFKVTIVLMLYTNTQSKITAHLTNRFDNGGDWLLNFIFFVFSLCKIFWGDFLSRSVNTNMDLALCQSAWEMDCKNQKWTQRFSWVWRFNKTLTKKKDRTANWKTVRFGFSVEEHKEALFEPLLNRLRRKKLIVWVKKTGTCSLCSWWAEKEWGQIKENGPTL